MWLIDASLHFSLFFIDFIFSMCLRWLHFWLPAISFDYLIIYYFFTMHFFFRCAVGWFRCLIFLLRWCGFGRFPLLFFRLRLIFFFLRFSSLFSDVIISDYFAVADFLCRIFRFADVASFSGLFFLRLLRFCRFDIAAAWCSRLFSDIWVFFSSWRFRFSPSFLSISFREVSFFSGCRLIFRRLMFRHFSVLASSIISGLSVLLIFSVADELFRCRYFFR